MDNNNIIDGFRSVCRDNIIALKKGQTVFIYKDDVFEETKKLCDKAGIEYQTKKEDWYYVIKNKNKNFKKDKFYKGKRGK